MPKASPNLRPKFNDENTRARDERRAKPLKKIDPRRAYFPTFKAADIEANFFVFS
nr:hypothetical protein [uncultured Psychrobacter sp.]